MMTRSIPFHCYVSIANGHLMISPRILGNVPWLLSTKYIVTSSHVKGDPTSPLSKLPSSNPFGRMRISIMIIQADKNLGPVGVDTEQYIRWALEDHLLDTTTYVQVSEGDAKQAAGKLFTEIYQWTRDYSGVDSLSLDHNST
jgi:hypothetical protein